MREALFIKKNKDKWQAYQNEPASSPDETAERFVNLIDDLSYAKTFYPKSEVTNWINGVAATIYQSIYKNKKENWSRIFKFWKYDLPHLFKQYQKVLLFTTIVFVCFVAIGALASKSDPEFIRGVLGDRYVNMTEKNIESGDPFGVYKDDSKFSMFIRIAFNNIKVAFITFISGLTLGIFTIKLLWSNGVMLGTFQQIFFAHGLGLQSILVVWIHGTIEISSIVIAGAAGFIVARSILFPKTFTRLQSFKKGMKDAAKIMLALIPFFIIAAFLESYITHLMSARFDGKSTVFIPEWVSVIILAGSAYLILWYFVFWPIKLHKQGYNPAEQSVADRLIHVDA